MMNFKNNSNCNVLKCKHEIIILLNETLEITFDKNYVNLRKYMIEQAIYNAEITPTTDDLNDIASDCIPSSLRYNNVHSNAKGYEVAGKLLLT
jgi:hypothetical protein